MQERAWTIWRRSGWRLPCDPENERSRGESGALKKRKLRGIVFRLRFSQPLPSTSTSTCTAQPTCPRSAGLSLQIAYPSLLFCSLPPREEQQPSKDDIALKSEQQQQQQQPPQPPPQEQKESKPDKTSADASSEKAASKREDESGDGGKLSFDPNRLNVGVGFLMMVMMSVTLICIYSLDHISTPIRRRCRPSSTICNPESSLT